MTEQALAVAGAIRGWALWRDRLLGHRENVLGRLLEAFKGRLGLRRGLRHEQHYTTFSTTFSQRGLQ